MVEGEHREALQRLVKEFVISIHHIGKEDVRAFAAQLHGGGDEVVGGSVQDALAHRGGAGEGNFGNALAGGQRLASLFAVAIDDVEHAGGQQVGNQVHQHQDGRGGLLGRFHHYAAASGQGRGQFPAGHQQGKVPGNDLPDHANGLIEVVGHGFGVNFRDRALLRTDAAGKVAKVVNAQGNIGGGGFAQRFAVVDGFCGGQQVDVLLHAVGNFQQDQ